MNQVKRLKAHHKVVKAKVSMRTGLDIEELNLMQFNHAIRFLKETLSISEYGISKLTADRRFWAWWETEWARIDRIYLEHLPADCKDAAERYHAVHNSKMDVTSFHSLILRSGGKDLIANMMWDENKTDQAIKQVFNTHFNL